jgi:hypothetical protein
MNKSRRIKVTPGEEVNKYVKVKLDQDTDTLEILTLKIGQTDIYSSFNANFGVIVGRVLGNNSIGVPNAKISVFIPITEEDKLRSEILAIYPYESVRDKDQEGRKYNLLPRIGVNNPFILPGEYSPPVPMGSFPTKEEIYTNPSYLEVYKKYYKYTTVTNQKGDYMIYGVPIGVQDLHCSVDVTDIGTFSMTPGTLVSQLGYSANLFNGNKVKYTTDLENAPHIELQTASVNVRPFWGDRDNYEIGITRQDFKIRTTLVSSVTIFGAGFTDNFEASWGQDSYYGDRDDSSSAMSRNFTDEFAGNAEGTRYNLGIGSKRIAPFKIEIYTIPNRVSDADIAAGNYDPATDLILMNPTEYSEISDDGQFILTLPCNRNKVAVNDLGELVKVSDDDPNGVFTEFVGAFIFEYGVNLEMKNQKSTLERDRTDRVKIKFPQTASPTRTFSSERPTIGSFINPQPDQASRIQYNEAWSKQVFRFKYGRLYAVSKFNGTSYEDEGASDYEFNDSNRNPFRNAGAITISTDGDNATGFINNGTPNLIINGAAGNLTINSTKTFAAEWLNFCIYFPQIFNYTSGDVDVTRLLTNDSGGSTDMTVSNNYLVVGTRRDTCYFLRSDVNPTTFVEVPRQDIINILQNAPDKKGFKTSESPFNTNPLVGVYPGNGTTKYFYRGLGSADVLAFLVSNGVISV